jgi:hypothetical protein
MRKPALQFVTWVTLTAAVLSAVWLSTVDADSGAALRQPLPRQAPASR